MAPYAQDRRNPTVLEIVGLRFANPTYLAEKVQSFTDGMDQDSFVSDALTYDATLRNLELIGEAATHIPDAVRMANPEVPWRTIVGTRNRVAHGYLGIDDDLLWDIIQNEIPVLLLVLRRIRGITE